MKEQITIQRILQSRLTSARARNPGYSVRAFSKQVGISAGTLSLIMLGKRAVSRKLAEKIARNLLLDPQERSEILSLFAARKRNATATRPGDSVAPAYLQLTADQYKLVGDWHYFAILNLTVTCGFRNDPVWIADRLGLSVTVVTDALERLKRLEMVRETVDGSLERVNPRFRTTDDIANESLRRSHHQNLELARESLEGDPLSARDFTWLTLPVDMRRMPQAKELIRKFQDEFLEAMRDGLNAEGGTRFDQVYRMAVQFFPLTKTDPK